MDAKQMKKQKTKQNMVRLGALIMALLMVMGTLFATIYYFVTAAGN